MNVKTLITVTMILFAVIDIIGSIPVILEIRKKSGDIHAEKATLVSLLLMLIFLFLGEEILQLVGIDVGSFAIAGSFILFFIALEMVTGLRIHKETVSGSTSIVPVAFPLIAGAGTMTTLISLRSQYDYLPIISAIVINMIPVYLVLRNTSRIEKFLKPEGIEIVRKVFGVILLAIAVKLFRNNIGVQLP